MNFYDILELPADATQLEIKQSFRKLAKQYHPDISNDPEAEPRFKLVYIAYEILSDPYKRSIYNEIQIIKIAEENLRMRRWQNNASKRADIFADMEFDSFEDKIRKDVLFHVIHFIATIFYFCILCVGFVLLMIGYDNLFNNFVENKIMQGCAFSFLGVILVLVAARGLYDAFNAWQSNKSIL